jgi:hypothetical protein
MCLQKTMISLLEAREIYLPFFCETALDPLFDGPSYRPMEKFLEDVVI